MQKYIICFCNESPCLIYNKPIIDQFADKVSEVLSKTSFFCCKNSTFVPWKWLKGILDKKVFQVCGAYRWQLLAVDWRKVEENFKAHRKHRKWGYAFVYLSDFN